MAIAVIISSMPVPATMRAYIPADAFIVAADAGWQRALELGVKPQLIVGDFDSSSKPKMDAECICLPAEKNDTDTHFAAREVLRRGFSEVIMLGGLGGRLDHMIANMHTLLFLAQNGAVAMLADEQNEIRCIYNGTLNLYADAQSYLSVFAAGGNARGVYLQGVKYPLYNAELRPDFPIGASNEFEGPQAAITVTEGALFVAICKKDQNGVE